LDTWCLLDGLVGWIDGLDWWLGILLMLEDCEGMEQVFPAGKGHFVSDFYGKSMPGRGREGVGELRSGRLREGWIC
jgi:hypothetical protein